MLNSRYKIPERLVIFTRDVQNITGLKERAARNLLVKIKIAFSKSSKAYVTIDEFCTFTEIPEERVMEHIQMNR
jgi:hypothetical protein